MNKHLMLLFKNFKLQFSNISQVDITKQNNANKNQTGFREVCNMVLKENEWLKIVSFWGLRYKAPSRYCKKLSLKLPLITF